MLSGQASIIYLLKVEILMSFNPVDKAVKKYLLKVEILMSFNADLCSECLISTESRNFNEF